MIRRFLICSLLAAPMIALSACGEEEDGISQYDVPKPRKVLEENHVGSIAPPDKPQAEPVRPVKKRLMGLIVNAGAKTWYFKLIGPDEQVKNVGSEKFLEFVASITFQDGEPNWKVPAGWEQLPAGHPRNQPKSRFSFKRFATILVAPEEDRSLELTVTSLPNRATNKQEADEFLLANINRWRRDQLGMKPRTLKNLVDKDLDSGDPENTDEVRARTIDGKDAWLVQFVGTPDPQRAKMPPFMRR